MLFRLLEDYRKERQAVGDYAEAQKATAKHTELQQQEALQQLKTLRQVQRAELLGLEEAHQEQFLEFSSTWATYMADYESSAFNSLQRLKEKHLLQHQEFHAKVQREAKSSVKPSKGLLQLRQRQQALAKQKQYTEAEKAQDTADQLEQWERAQNESKVKNAATRRRKYLKKEQQLALFALMKRIQRDRDEQVRHRDEDLARLLQRNKNTLRDLAAKHNSEAKNGPRTLG